MQHVRHQVVLALTLCHESV